MIRVIQGDCREVLKTLPPDSVDCVVTSPPYWGLRDYGVDGQIGLEHSLGEHLNILVDVFREVRRVLKKTGTAWLNYGDAYACAPNGRSAAATKALGNDDRTFRDKPISTVGPIDRGKRTASRWGGGNNPASGTLKPKDRMLLPARLAIALQEDGWWVRDEIIWHKPNPMPSSVKDRTTPAHEMIYMLSKAERYFYDHTAIKEPRASNEDAKTFRGGAYVEGNIDNATVGQRKVVGNRKVSKYRDLGAPNRQIEGFNDRWDAAEDQNDGLRAKRSVWTVPPKGFKEAHFATFPPDLIRPCILAGCPAGGVVLDPFYGAGTVGLVASELGRDCIGIELNPAYIEIAERRVRPTMDAMLA